MGLFEVFIPATGPEGFNITTKIEADTWIQALRSGLSKLGDAADVQNIMVDINEHGIDVTEPASGRVFRIKELNQGAAPAPAASAPPPAAAAPPPAAVAPPPAAAAPPPAATAPPPAAAAPPPAAAAPPPAAVAPPPAAAAPPPAAAAPPPAAAAPPPAAAAPAPLIAGAARFTGDSGSELGVEHNAPAPAVAVGRQAVAAVRPMEEILGDLFFKTADVFEYDDIMEAAAYMLDLANQAIPCESGAVFVSDINRNDLYFAAATGPKAGDVMSFRVPMGQGIVGFSAQSGVSLAISDVHKDPHFFAAISKKLGYDTRSILCSPAQKEGRVFGALELINKSSGSTFSAEDVNVLNFISHEFAEYLVGTGQTGD